MIKKKYFTGMKRYFLLLLGAFILSFGLFNIHNQSQITEGGVLGMTLFLNYWTGISPSISGVLMDITCYALAFKYLGKAFLKYALVASLGFSFFYSVHEHFGYVIPNLSSHPLVAATLGGLFVGVGVGFVVRAGGASGGDDALALVISQVGKISLSKAYFLTDFVVLMLSLTYIPVTKILCSLVTVSISSFIIEKIHSAPSMSLKNRVV